MSSPGAGKTTLLERTLDALAGEVRCAVLVGDLETDNDARRLRREGLPVAQITTGGTCHLDASMVARGPRGAAARGRPAAVHRKRRQPGLPGVVRSRREPPDHAALVHRRRGQAAQIPADLHQRPRGHPEQDRCRGRPGFRPRGRAWPTSGASRRRPTSSNFPPAPAKDSTAGWRICGDCYETARGSRISVGPPLAGGPRSVGNPARTRGPALPCSPHDARRGPHARRHRHRAGRGVPAVCRAVGVAPRGATGGSATTATESRSAPARRQRLLDDFAARLRAEAPPAARIAARDRDPGRETESGLPPRRPVPALLILPSERPARRPPPRSRPTWHCATIAGGNSPTPPTAGTRYPFINCTNCGPRYSILRELPLRPAAHDHGRLSHVPRLPARVR